MQTLSTTGRPDLPVARSSGYLYPFIACLIYGAFSDYFLLCAVGGLVLSFIVRELWRPYLPAALLYYFVFQWAQIFTIVPYMDFLDGNTDFLGNYVDVDLMKESSRLLVSVSLLHIGLMAWVVGRYLKKVKGISAFSIKRGALLLNTKRVLIAFLIANLFYVPLFIATKFNPFLNQLVTSMSVVPKLFLVLLIFILFTKRDKFRGLIIVILVVQFLLSFTSYFSDFKEIILFFIIVFLTVKPELNMRKVFRLIPLVALLFYFATFWQYVKQDYRLFLSGGTKQQITVRSKGESLNYLLDQFNTFDSKGFRNGSEMVMERIQMMKWFFKVYKRVPAFIPFEEGKNTLSSVTFITLPRALNPNKGVIDPSTKTTYFTGIRLANVDMGTSIAMGYLPDFYVDFGLYGMVAPLLLLACFLGWASKKILERKNYNTVFNYSLFIGTVFVLGTLETDLTFYLGTIRNLIVLFIIGKWFFKWLNRYLTS